MTGWISLHRQIRNHWIWDDAEKLKWWLDILLLTNHTDKKSLYNNEVVLIKRGTFKTSEVKLSERWGVSRNTVRKFLKLLEGDEMITTEKTPYGTTVKVCNYNDYQGFSGKEKQVREHPREQHFEQHQDTPVNNSVNSTVNTTNNYNNSNNEPIMKNNDKKTGDIREIIAFYENNGYGVIGQSVTEEIDGWYEEGFEKEAIILAFQIALDNNDRRMKYIRGIFNNWRRVKTYTIADIEKEEKRRKVKNFKHQNFSPSSQDTSRQERQLAEMNARLEEDAKTGYMPF